MSFFFLMFMRLTVDPWNMEFFICIHRWLSMLLIFSYIYLLHNIYFFVGRRMRVKDIECFPWFYCTRTEAYLFSLIVFDGIKYFSRSAKKYVLNEVRMGVNMGAKNTVYVIWIHNPYYCFFLYIYIYIFFSCTFERWIGWRI